jgi:hypothetical protein
LYSRSSFFYLIFFHTSLSPSIMRAVTDIYEHPDFSAADLGPRDRQRATAAAIATISVITAVAAAGYSLRVTWYVLALPGVPDDKHAEIHRSGDRRA